MPSRWLSEVSELDGIPCPWIKASLGLALPTDKATPRACAPLG